MSLTDGLVYEGGDIGASLAGFEICLTMLKEPVKWDNYHQWSHRERRKPSRATAYIVQVLYRHVDDEYWSLMGHFGPRDELNYVMWNTEQVRDLMTWLDAWCGEQGFCAPIPGSTCHRDAPKLL